MSNETPPLTAGEIERPPYDAQEQRVCDWIQKQTGGMVGCGDDPIGFLLASYEFSRHELHEARAALSEKDRRIAELERDNERLIAEIASIRIDREGGLGRVRQQRDAAEARIAELERERDAERLSRDRLETSLWKLIDRDGLANCGSDLVDAVAWMTTFKAKLAAAEALSAAAVERERVMREALQEIADNFPEALGNFARAALSSPAPGNGEADHAD